MSSDDDNDSDSEVDTDNLLSVHDGLSLETLQALLQFQEYGFTDDDEEDVTGKTSLVAPISSALGYMAFTQGDANVIEETYRRLQAKDDTAVLLNEDVSFSGSLRIEDLKQLIDSTTSYVEILKRDGVVRMDNLLDKNLCQAILDSINITLESADSNAPGFGNVFSRHQRYDMYLRPEGPVQDALKQMMNETEPLGALFKSLLDNKPGPFHELSSIIVDPDADAQPIHPDAKFSIHCPMWTVFCSLQDIDETMGPTVMLPGSHTKEAHEQFNTAGTRTAQLANAIFTQATLLQGDIVVMDSRCLHFGSANTSKKRRVLFYFTIRNPLHDGDYPDCGSLFEDLNLTTDDIKELVTA